VSQAQGFQLWEASGEEAEQLLTFGVIEQLVRAAPDSGGQADRVLTLIGEEQRVVADGLEFGFQFLAEGTICEGAALQCLAVPGITVLVDEVELDGDPPTILRPTGAEVVEPPHDHAHTGHNGVTMAPVVSADMKGGA
jgi:hypothetical protein